MLKRFVSVVCMVSLLISVFSTLASAQQKMTLTVWDWHSPRMEALKPKLEEYSKLHPEIEFKTMIVSGDEYWKKLLAGIMAGQAPADIIQFHNAQTTRFVQFLTPYPEDLFPLSKIRKEYLNFDAGFVMPDGKMYYYPLGIMSSLIYYNVDMWKKAGLGATPKTWEELRTAAKKLTKYDDKGKIQVAGFAFTGGGYLQYIWEDFKYQQGGWLYNKDGTGADESYTGTPGIKSLTFLRDLIFKDKVTEPGFLTFTEAFGTQKAAMVYGWTWFTGWVNYNYPKLKYGAFTLPTESGKMYPVVARNNWEVQYAVLKSVPEEKKQAAFKFLKWLYDDNKYAIKLNQELGTVPGKKALWGDPGIRLDPVLRVLNKEIPYTIFPGERPEFIDPILNNLETRIFQGMSVEDALKATKAELDNALKENPVKWNVERKYKPPKE